MLLLGFAILVGALTAPAQAGYEKTYRDAIKAVDFEEWMEAARLLRLAIQQHPPRALGKRVRIYGNRFERYLPHYFLGLVSYRRGDCAVALEAFARSLQEDAVAGVQRGRLVLFSDICQQRLGRPVASPVPAPSQSPALPPGPPSGNTATPRSGNPTWPPPTTRSGSRTPTAPPVSTPPSTPPARRDPPGTSTGVSTGPTSPPTSRSKPPPRTTKEVRARQLAKKIAAAEKSLARGRQLAQQVETRRSSAAFRRDPDNERKLAAAQRRLDSAQFHLEAGRSEGDLDSVDRAFGEAEAASELLETLP